MKNILNPNALYISDNGMIVCSCCAGVTSATTGADLYGALYMVSATDIFMMGGSMSCEQGCKTVTAPL